MGGRAFHRAGAEFDVDIIVADDDHLFMVGGIDGMLADQVLEALVVRIDNHADVAEHRFGSGCRNRECFPCFGYFVIEVVHLAGIILVIDFDVGKRCSGFRMVLGPGIVFT